MASVKILPDSQTLHCSNCQLAEMEEVQQKLGEAESPITSVRLISCKYMFLSQVFDLLTNGSVIPLQSIIRIKILLQPLPERDTNSKKGPHPAAENFIHSWVELLRTHTTSLQKISVSPSGWHNLDMGIWQSILQFDDLIQHIDALQLPCCSIHPKQIPGIFANVTSSMLNLSVLDTRGIPMTNNSTTAFAKCLTSFVSLEEFRFGGNDTWVAAGVVELCNFLRGNRGLETLIICTSESNLLKEDDPRLIRQLIVALNNHPSLTSFGLYRVSPKQLRAFARVWSSTDVTSRISSFNIRHVQERSPLGTYDQLVIPALCDILVGYPFLQSITLNLEIRPSIQNTRKLIEVFGGFPRLRSVFCSFIATPLDSQAIEKWSLATINRSAEQTSVTEMSQMIIEEMGIPVNVGELITSFSETLIFSGILSWHFGPRRDPYINPAMKSALERNWRGDVRAVAHRRRSNVFFE